MSPSPRNFEQGKTISGRGIFLIPLSDVDPETGEMSPATCYAHACLIAEVEVDDETGEVTVLKVNNVYRDRPRDEPENGRTATRRRLVDGHQPRAL